VVQLFFFLCLRVEEYLCTTHLFYALLFAGCIPLELTLLAGNSSDPYFWYLLFFFLFNLYYRLKEVFLNPLFEGSAYPSWETEFEQGQRKLTWDSIVLNMSSISKGLFKVAVENQLSSSMSRRPFPYIAKRYVFTRMFQAIKGNPEVVGAVGVTSTILGIAYSEQKNAQRHRENLQVARETSEASVKAQQKLVDAQLAVAQSQATLARSQERLAVAQERANALKM